MTRPPDGPEETRVSEPFSIGETGGTPRRAFLKLLAGGAAGGVLVEILAVAGCGGAAPEGPPTVTLPLEDLSPGTRLVVMLGETPVEVRREGERVIARSLVCTHQGCTVKWREEENRYRCPCQEAYFDANGQPLLGPVSKPLPEFPVTIAAGVVTVATTLQD